MSASGTHTVAMTVPHAQIQSALTLVNVTLVTMEMAATVKVMKNWQTPSYRVSVVFNIFPSIWLFNEIVKIAAVKAGNGCQLVARPLVVRAKFVPSVFVLRLHAKRLLRGLCLYKHTVQWCICCLFPQTQMSVDRAFTAAMPMQHVTTRSALMCVGAIMATVAMAVIVKVLWHNVHRHVGGRVQHASHLVQVSCNIQTMPDLCWH